MARVLIACEFSGIVREAFHAHGHDAWSCDLESTEQDGQHIQGDVLTVLDKEWDLLIAHPPCTYLCNSGARWWPQRRQAQAEALIFVRRLLDAPIPRIALENPNGIISTHIRLPDQTIQPYMFDEDARKATCLWLKNLPCLRSHTMREASRMYCPACLRVFLALYGFGTCECLGGVLPKPIYGNQTIRGQNNQGWNKQRTRDRSRTFPGIAQAMVAQWGPLLLMPTSSRSA